MPFNQFDNFLFTEQEFNDAGDYQELPIKCLQCGVTFYKRKKVIASIISSQKRLQYIKYCSEHQQLDRYVEVQCAYCGEKHQRLKSEVDKQLKSREKRNVSTNQFFCDHNCARAYIAQNNIKRVRKSTKTKKQERIVKNVRVVVQNVDFKQSLLDIFGDVIDNNDNTYNIQNLHVVFHPTDEIDVNTIDNDNTVHVYQWEWETKHDLILNLISSRLGLFDKRLYARQCTVRDLDSQTYNQFVRGNHLHCKSPNCEIRLGLFYGDELVSVVGFAKGRFDDSNYELIRYCVKQRYQIIGGFSKLIKHSNLQSFISYVDLAHYNGAGYEKTGFKVLGKTQSNYVYVKQGIVLSRYQCQKHKLAKLLGDQFDDSKSELRNMIDAGYMKVKDRGNLKLLYERNIG